MSLYVGKDVSNIGLLHITSSENTVAELRSGLLPNTVFNSELPYVEWTEYPCWATVVRDIPFIQVSTDTANALGSSVMFFVAIGGTVIQSSQDTFTGTAGFMSIKYGMWFKIENYNGGFYRPRFYPSGEYYLFLPPWGSNLTDIHVYALNIINGSFGGVTKTNNEILINRDNFIIRGVILSSLRYVSCNKKNDSDKLYSLNGSQLQLINSTVNTSNIMSMVINNTEASIYRNGNAIFTSKVGGGISYYGTGAQTISIGRYDINAYGTITLPTECIGSVCCLQCSWTGGSLEKNTNFSIVNKPLLIKVGDETMYQIARLVDIEGSPTFVLAEVSANSNNLNFHLYVHSSTVPRGNMTVKYIYFR